MKNSITVQASAAIGCRFSCVALLLLSAALSGCQPGAATPRRPAANDRSEQQSAAAADQPDSAVQAVPGKATRAAEGTGSEAASDPPGSDAAAAAESAEGKAGQAAQSATTAATATNTKRGGTQPASQDEEELLLLDDEPLTLESAEEQADQLPATAADNSRCRPCHLSLVDEQLVVTHARAKIGCADCHGNCDAHIADESWASGGNGTPPGIMYPKEKINPFCLDCHPREKIDADQHKALFAGTSKEKYCTDCHGKHRLTERKCKWK